MNYHCYSLELGTILRNVPDPWRSDHGLVTVRDAYALGFANRLWGKREAVLVHFRAVMERAQAHGHGNRAARRIGKNVKDTRE